MFYRASLSRLVNQILASTKYRELTNMPSGLLVYYTHVWRHNVLGKRIPIEEVNHDNLKNAWGLCLRKIKKERFPYLESVFRKIICEKLPVVYLLSALLQQRLKGSTYLIVGQLYAKNIGQQ